MTTRIKTRAIENDAVTAVKIAPENLTAINGISFNTEA